MKKVHVSTIPGLKSRIDLITIFTLAGLVLQGVNTAPGWITSGNVIMYLVVVGVNVLLIYNLYAALKRERTYAALGVISTTLKILFIGMCVLTGLFSLIVLLTLISFNVADSAAGGVLVTIMVLLIVLAAMLVILAKFYRYTAKTAKQLRNDTYDGSKKPETWALVNAAVSLAMLLLRLILVFIPLMRLGNAIDQSSSTLSGYLTEALVNSGSINLLSSMPGMALSLCQCASFYCVYLLLKTVRLNMPVTKK